jgi:DNA-binding transcriptional ArsR family regulator
MKHLRVLENAGLIAIERKGRFRWNYLNPIPIQEIYDRWICHYTAGLSGRMTSLKRQLENEEA